MCALDSVYVRMYRGGEGVQGFRCPGAGVSGPREPPSKGARNQSSLFYNSSMHSLKICYYLIMYVQCNVCLYVCIYMQVNVGASRGEVLELQQELQEVMSCLIRMLGTDLGSSARSIFFFF